MLLNREKQKNFDQYQHQNNRTLLPLPRRSPPRKNLTRQRPRRMPSAPRLRRRSARGCVWSGSIEKSSFFFFPSIGGLISPFTFFFHSTLTLSGPHPPPRKTHTHTHTTARRRRRRLRGGRRGLRRSPRGRPPQGPLRGPPPHPELGALGPHLEGGQVAVRGRGRGDGPGPRARRHGPRRRQVVLHGVAAAHVDDPARRDGRRGRR